VDAGLDNIVLNHEPCKIIHIDLNSCFATVEQQSRPSLRGKPIGVTNRITKNCCVVAASIEAKARGVKVGMGRVEATQICPELIMLETDPPKYHWAYRNLMRIMNSYSPNVKMKSIDEGLIDLHGCEALRKGPTLTQIGYEIKRRLRSDLGCWVRCNIGIAPNRFLAKVAAGLHKPDGLDTIDHTNLIKTYKTLALTDLTGIGKKYARRLAQHSINTPLEFLMADEQRLVQVFGSKVHAGHWYRRLRGFEVDDYTTHQGQVGRQFVLDQRTNDNEILLSRLQYLAQTSAMKLRSSGHDARGVLVWCTFGDTPKWGDGRPYGFWHKRQMFPTAAYTDQEIFRRARQLFMERPGRTVTAIGMTCYGLVPSSRNQTSFDPTNLLDENLTAAVDAVNNRYGNFVITYADALDGKKVIKQKIPFGSTRYFELLIS
jgi:DNA polymerase-4